MTTEAELRVQNVSKYFGGVQAISQVSLEVRRGEIVSIIGPNGAGKTTLLNMISGFYHPDVGAISLDDRDITISGSQPHCRSWYRTHLSEYCAVPWHDCPR